MSNNNQFQPYRYSQSREGGPPPQGLNLSAARYAGEEVGILGGAMKRPVFVMAGLLLFATVFAAVLLATYSGGSSEGDDLPIIQAEARPIKSAPQDAFGRESAADEYGGSTIYQSAELGDVPEAAPVENLLDRSASIAKLEMFAREAEQLMAEQKAAAAAADTVASFAAVSDGSSSGISLNTDAAVPETPQEHLASAADSLKTATPAVPYVAGGTQSVAARVVVPTDVRPAGSSPETLAFVRSVLDQRDESKKEGAVPKPTKKNVVAKAKAATSSADKAARAVAAIKPAAGYSPPKAIAIAPGSYYVQLGSVRSQTGAHSEWGKIKSKYSTALSRSNYRVMRADLADKGTFFRIQAGPMSKASASNVCGSIKASAGGCFVTQ